jgi:hypothetical protein
LFVGFFGSGSGATKEARFAISDRILIADHITIVTVQTRKGVARKSIVRSNIRTAYRRCSQR